MKILFWFVSVFQMYLEQPKQTDLFQNKPKQTKNGLKDIKSTQKPLTFQLQFPKQTETERKNGTKNKLKLKNVLLSLWMDYALILMLSI